MANFPMRHACKETWKLCLIILVLLNVTTMISCMQTAQVHLVKPKGHGVQTIKKELLEVGSLIMKQTVRNILISTFILLLNFLPSPGALTQVQQDLCQFVDNNVIGR